MFYIEVLKHTSSGRELWVALTDATGAVIKYPTRKLVNAEFKRLMLTAEFIYRVMLI